eukprot:TRINITY_DN1215_c0_g1_i6.p1 TRINITY_DN1215_c0_g1~~TRINITY_DN1215_c0_g1_i6.p1  ORF type:complete len:278 (-),score=61.71 TRINITY_DN1215_c0_g1_i6:665-1498(-)
MGEATWPAWLLRCTCDCLVPPTFAVTSSPPPPLTRLPVALISVGTSFTCVVLGDATAKCWGQNYYGQLGYGDKDYRGDDPGEMGDALPVIDVGTGRTVVALSAGISHACAVLDDATAKCWGRNHVGQLGYNDTDYRGDDPGEMGDALPAILLGTGRSVVAISVAGLYRCAVLDDATAKCWGRNHVGQLGHGDLVDHGDDLGQMGDALPAIEVGTGRSVVAISAAGLHTCALLDDATAKCWGLGTTGGLGYGDKDYRGDDPGEMGDALPAVEVGFYVP